MSTSMDLHLLPKIRDGWSYLYVEHAKIEQEAKGICGICRAVASNAENHRGMPWSARSPRRRA